MQGNYTTLNAPTDEAISLSHLSAVLGAHVAVCSSPELDLDGKNVMRIIEQLPKHMLTENQYSVTSLVDFAGSTSGDLCKQKIRTVEGGIAKTHEDDFERDLTGIAEYQKYKAHHEADFKEKAEQSPSKNKKTADELAKQGFAIKNSQWNSYWRGKVAGGLSMALTVAAGKPINDDELKTLKIGRLQKSSLHLRAVIAVMIDGGPVTQQEQREMPQICDDVVFDLRRQGYDWASNAHVLLVRFPDVDTMLQSLAGEPNLCRSKHLERKQKDDFLYVTVGSHNLAWEFKKHPKTKEYSGSSFFKADWKDALTYDVTYSAMNLHQCAASGDAEGTKQLLTKGVRITEAESGGCTALLACAAQGHLEIMHMLLEGFKYKGKEYKQFNNNDERKRYVNKKDPNGSAPLHLAANQAVAKFLLENNAEVDEKNTLGNTPLHLAQSEGVTKLLLERKAEVNSKGQNGCTPLHYAKTEGMAKLLLEHKAQVDAKSSDHGQTPLFYAEYFGRADVIKVLKGAQ